MATLTGRVAVTCLALLLAGCAGQTPTSSPDTPEAPVAVGVAWAAPSAVANPCTGCYEPAIAADHAGNLYVAAHRLGGVGVSEDGGATWEIRPVPEPASPSESAGGASDDLVQVAPWGTVYYTELWSDGGGIALAGVHLAGSDDGGRTWPVNTFIHLREGIANPSPATDRQWLAFSGASTVHLLYNCGASILICHLRSDDAGRTFGAPDVVMTPIDHSFPSPAGMPFIDHDGFFVAPYYADPRADTSTGARTVRVAFSEDGGSTWRHSTVYTHAGLSEGTSGGGWPHATFLADGTWMAGWSAAGTMYIARSSDKGASWSSPETYAPAETGGGGRPWLFGGLFAGQDDSVDAVWFGNGSVNWAHLPAEGEPGFASVPGGGNSDYPYFTYLPDGRVATVFLRDDALFVAIQA